MNKKQKFIQWDLEDYTILQREELDKLLSRYPSIPWRQLLSPYHCLLVFRYITDNIDDAVWAYRNAIAVYGNVTTTLNWILHIISGSDHSAEYIYEEKKSFYGLDGDKLADILLKRQDLSYPFTVIKEYRNEIENEIYIMRDPIPFEALEWVSNYVGKTSETMNIIEAWNLNKSAYYKHRLESEGW